MHQFALSGLAAQTTLALLIELPPPHQLLLPGVLSWNGTRLYRGHSPIRRKICPRLLISASAGRSSAFCSSEAWNPRVTLAPVPRQSVTLLSLWRAIRASSA